MEFDDSGSMWIENRDGHAELLRACVQFVSDKTRTARKSTRLVPYLVRTILLNVSATRLE